MNLSILFYYYYNSYVSSSVCTFAYMWDELLEGLRKLKVYFICEKPDNSEAKTFV